MRHEGRRDLPARGRQRLAIKPLSPGRVASGLLVPESANFVRALHKRLLVHQLSSYADVLRQLVERLIDSYVQTVELCLPVGEHALIARVGRIDSGG